MKATTSDLEHLSQNSKLYSFLNVISYLFKCSKVKHREISANARKAWILEQSNSKMQEKTKQCTLIQTHEIILMKSVDLACSTMLHCVQVPIYHIPVSSVRQITLFPSKPGSSNPGQEGQIQPEASMWSTSGPLGHMIKHNRSCDLVIAGGDFKVLEVTSKHS